MPFYCNPPISDTDESQHAPLEQIWNWTWNLLNYFIGEPNPWVCFMLKGTHQKVLKFGTANLLPPSPKISIKLNALVFRIDSLPWPLFLRAVFLSVVILRLRPCSTLAMDGPAQGKTIPKLRPGLSLTRNILARASRLSLTRAKRRSLPSSGCVGPFQSPAKETKMKHHFNRPRLEIPHTPTEMIITSASIPNKKIPSTKFSTPHKLLNSKFEVCLAFPDGV